MIKVALTLIFVAALSMIIYTAHEFGKHYYKKNKRK